jgi:type II secretory pathway component PulF
MQQTVASYDADVRESILTASQYPVVLATFKIYIVSTKLISKRY